MSGKQADRLSGPEIDHQLKFRGLLDRQLGRLLAFENAAGVDAGARLWSLRSERETFEPQGRA